MTCAVVSRSTAVQLMVQLHASHHAWLLLAAGVATAACHGMYTRASTVDSSCTRNRLNDFLRHVRRAGALVFYCNLSPHYFYFRKRLLVNFLS